MRFQRRLDPLALAAVEQRRQRQDAASPLRDEVVGLRSLRLAFEDHWDHGAMDALRYARPIPVSTARAHFEFRCLAPGCDGTHDLTAAILGALRVSMRSFAGASRCSGMVGQFACGRAISYKAEATYGGQPASAERPPLIASV